MQQGWFRGRPGLGTARLAIAAGTLVLGLAGAASAEVVVAIDPGHGGIDPGASSGGLVEKQVVLGFAHRLAAHIDAAEGMRAVLIRDDDIFVALFDRVRRARAAGAHLIVSLHADTTDEGKAEGAHVYTLSEEGSDDAAVLLAERENRADVIGGVALAGEADDLARLLVDLAQRGTEAESENLAGAMIEALDGAVPLLYTSPHRRANFKVLKAPEIPSILVELGYMSNPRDRERLVSEDWQETMAAALARGIALWAGRASAGFLAPKQ